ncbi:MAG: calcium-binding protein [Formosimonas sp.]
MGMFDYKQYTSSQSAELMQTSYQLAIYSQVNGLLGISSSAQILKAINDSLLSTGLYANAVNQALPAGWRELTPAELSLPQSALDSTGQYIIESPLTGTTPTGEQAKILGQYDAQGKLLRVAVSYTGTNSLVDIPDYFQLNSGQLAPKLEPLLNAVKDFSIKNGLTADKVIFTGYSLGGGLTNLTAEYRNTLAGGFFKNANYVGVASPLIYDDPSVVLNYGYENDVVHRAIGSSDTVSGAVSAAGPLLLNKDKPYSSSIDNTVLFNDMYASPAWTLPFSIVNIPVAWYAHVDGVFSDGYSRIANNPFYNFMEKDSTTVVASLSALSRGTTWVEDKATATSSHFGTSAFIIGSKFDDLLKGGTAGDFIYGGEGNDIIRTGGGSDHIDGGSGVNELRLMGNSSDWNAYRLSDGTLFMDAKDQSNLVEAENIQRVSFEYELASLVNPYVVTNNSLLDQRAGLMSWLFRKDVVYQAKIEGTQGADNLSGKTLFGQAGNDTLNAISTGSLLHGGEGADVLKGNLGSDRLYGAEGNDVLSGSAGNDYLNGGVGHDTYQFGRGDGKDTVSESSGNDQIVFGTSVNANQLWLSRSGNDLLVSIIGSTDQMKIEHWYDNANFQVETFKTADGKILTAEKVDALVHAMAAFSPPTSGQSTLSASYQTALNPVLAASWL